MTDTNSTAQTAPPAHAFEYWIAYDGHDHGLDHWVIARDVGPNAALQVVASTLDKMPRDEANAHLMAAAPALLHSLKLTARVAHATHGRVINGTGFEACTRTMCFEARAAIQKASGR